MDGETIDSKVADRVAFMAERSLVEDAPTDDFFAAPRRDRARLFLSKILRH